MNLINHNSLIKSKGDIYQDCYWHPSDISLQYDLKIKVQVCPERDTPVTDEMIGMVNSCLTSLKQDISSIMEIAQNYYNNVFDQDFGLEGVPRDPEPSALAPHFGEGILYVGDADEEGEAIHNYLFFPIAWDEEHGFYLELKNDKWGYADGF